MIAQFGIVEFPKLYFTRFHINLIREEMDMFLNAFFCHILGTDLPFSTNNLFIYKIYMYLFL